MPWRCNSAQVSTRRRGLRQGVSRPVDQKQIRHLHHERRWRARAGRLRRYSSRMAHPLSARHTEGSVSKRRPRLTAGQVISPPIRSSRAISCSCEQSNRECLGSGDGSEPWGNRRRRDVAWFTPCACRKSRPSRWELLSRRAWRCSGSGGCGCRKPRDIMRPANIHGPSHRADPSAEHGRLRPGQAGVDARRVDSGAVTDAAGGNCNDRRTR